MPQSKPLACVLLVSGALATLLGPLPALAQPDAPAPAAGAEEAPEWMKRLAIDPSSSVAKRYAEQQKARVAAEKELRKIRARHFGTIRNVQMRQEGIVKVREFTDPAIFPSMITLFEKEKADVRTALLDHFQDAASREGDAAIAWMGVFDADEEVRADAARRLKARVAAQGQIPDPVKYSIFEGMRAGNRATRVSAAKLAGGIDMYDAVPWMIAALITGQPASAPQAQTAGFGVGGPNGSLGWIMVGQQTAFVSDLTPVVGPNAVAFDPQLSVVTEGVVLRVIDAVVVTYHVDMFTTLTDFTSRVMGAPTKQLGWDVPAWREWYAKEFVPHVEALRAKQDAARAAGTPAPK
ncbi:MAG: hypothetical protein SFY69_10950 [Planctomycetota bacterium]|nr:hypothetical protein [Planctomycetota bacterium]